MTSVSKVKNTKDTKTTPIPNKIKIVNLGEIEIFLNEKVGILLISKTATRMIR